MLTEQQWKEMTLEMVSSPMFITDISSPIFIAAEIGERVASN